MRPSRRLILNLTPLFDLMLIVIFAQYLSVLGQEQIRDEAVGKQQAEYETRLELLNQAAALAEQRALESQQALERQQGELEASQSNLDRALTQQRVLGELMVELFQIPPDEIARIVDPLATSGVRGANQVERLRQRFQEMSDRSAGRMIEHLLSYEEIRKRCDVWSLHVDAQGIATVSAGNNETRIRIVTTNGAVDIDRFVSDLYVWYRTLPQPKNLVIVLLTYDRASRIQITEAVRQALPIWVSRMQADTSGRIRFEYADIGFRLD